MNYSPEARANMRKWIERQNYILEQEMLEAKAKEMQTEMDREVLWSMLQGIGWCRVMLPRFVDNHYAIDITLWLLDNCKGNFEREGRDFLFENVKDANWFRLRWGTV